MGICVTNAHTENGVAINHGSWRIADALLCRAWTLADRKINRRGKPRLPGAGAEKFSSPYGLNLTEFTFGNEAEARPTKESSAIVFFDGVCGGSIPVKTAGTPISTYCSPFSSSAILRRRYSNAMRSAGLRRATVFSLMR